MTVKEQIIALFDGNKGKYFSGEDIANELSVSRNAVWKAVKALQSEGYDITAVPNKGYCLSSESDILSSIAISKFLHDHAKGLEIEVFKTLPSTNTYLKELASSGAAEGKVIVCEQQTSGRGRLGRSFFSPQSTGIYMSILLRPNLTSDNAVQITTLAAVAVCEAIEMLSGKKAEIKWVNDIYIEGKKVCGILTEASFSMENGGLEYVVLGIGINVYRPGGDFPSEISHIASSVFDTDIGDTRNQLTAEVLNRILHYYQNFSQKEFTPKYKERSFVIGRKIAVVEPNNQYLAKAIDIDDHCRLIIQTADGTKKTISTGEISIKV